MSSSEVRYIGAPDYKRKKPEDEEAPPAFAKSSSLLGDLEAGIDTGRRVKPKNDLAKIEKEAEE